MEHDNDIFWHALNYRTAATQHAEQMWQELESCVNRLIVEEREECAKLCQIEIDKWVSGEEYLDGKEAGAEDCLDSIRKRSNVKVRG